MAKIRFRLIKNTIYCDFTISKDKSFTKSMGLKTNSDDWKTRKSTRPNKDGNYKRIPDLSTEPTDATAKKLFNENLKPVKKFVLDSYNTDYAKGIDINKVWFKKALQNALNQGTDDKFFLSYQIQKAIDNAPRKKIPTKGGRFKIGLSKGRTKGIIQFKNIIERFESDYGNKIKVATIDKALIEEFEKWLSDQGYSDNYIGKQQANLKSILNDIEDVKVNIDTKKDIKVISEEKEAEEIIYLSLAELEQIKNAELPSNYLKNARKWLILGCHTGQRASDLLRLSEDKIELYRNQRVFRIKQKKTGKKVTIPIVPEVDKIIKSGFPYPLSQTKLREYFKEVCRIAGIDEPAIGRIRQSGKHGTTIKGTYPKYQLIGTHVCRRSFASNYYGNMPTPILIAITGHGTEKMFLNYIGKNDDDLAIQMLNYLDKMPKVKTMEIVRDNESKTGTDK